MYHKSKMTFFPKFKRWIKKISTKGLSSQARSEWSWFKEEFMEVMAYEKLIGGTKLGLMVARWR